MYTPVYYCVIQSQGIIIFVYIDSNKKGCTIGIEDCHGTRQFMEGSAATSFTSVEVLNDKVFEMNNPDLALPTFPCFMSFNGANVECINKYQYLAFLQAGFYRIQV